ncbi:MAG TPA: RtcB family protein [Bacteroidales bacterium]|nr:RtcB family protein [Bacteroidales bacterium]
MKKVISSEKIPIKMWLDEVEPDAMKQAINLANLPFAFRHIALMPDTHVGYGMPIGGVLAARDVIVPNAVGVDIGCGMCTVRTNLDSIQTNKLKEIMSGIRALVPLGFNHHKYPQNENLMPSIDNIVEGGIVEQEYDSALRQLGTLGSGNHFIEIQRGSDGFIWIMVHSGSRNIGLKVAEFYNKQAKILNRMWYTKVNEKDDLAFFPVETLEAQKYINEMQYCIDFAFANRKLMLENVISVFKEHFGKGFETDNFINIAHNYAAKEKHFETDVIVHRKGATSARKDELGIIPGSQGTKSYIVRGKGNPESFESCSHGAGRIMGRKEAIRSLDLKEQTAFLNEQGILHAIRGRADLEEAPGAYKNIDEVMEDQQDLVEIVVELSPLAVIKG